jgi:cytochrome P450
MAASPPIGILDISRRNSVFHNADRSTTVASQAGLARVREITGGGDNLVRSMVRMDEPDHMKYRMLTQAWFMPAHIARREAQIRAMARHTVRT